MRTIHIMEISLAEADEMELGEGQCQNAFRLDRESCRACAGYNKTCPSYSPAGPGQKTVELNRLAFPDSSDGRG